MIAIVDYGLGNIRSLSGAIERLGFETAVSDSAEILSKSEKLVLPGVGAFGDGMKNLRARGLVETLERLVCKEGKPILGICLGAQLFSQVSHEFGTHEGLGWLDAEVRKIESPGARLPHVGWNELQQDLPSPLFEGIPQCALFYYVHSYCVDCLDTELVLGTCEYGERFAAVIQKENIVAAQFHPEKSQQYGLCFLNNFLNML